MIGYQHPGHRFALQVLVQRGDAVREAGRLQDHELSGLLQQEHLVRQRVAGLAGVEPHAAEVVNVHLALAQLDGRKIALIHETYLQMVCGQGGSPCDAFIIA